MLPQIAQGESNKVWIIPSEITQALGQLGAALARAGSRRRPRRHPSDRAGRPARSQRRWSATTAGVEELAPEVEIDMTIRADDPEVYRGHEGLWRYRGGHHRALGVRDEVHRTSSAATRCSSVRTDADAARAASGVQFSEPDRLSATASGRARDPDDAAHRRRCARSRTSRPVVRAPPASSLSQPMFDSLSDRLQAALGDVRSRGKLTEDDVNKAMRQVRLALLEADVNFKVVKQFTDGGEGARARPGRARPR